MSFESNKSHIRVVKEEVEKDFFFLGMIPKKHTIELDDELKERGVDEISSLKINKLFDKEDILWMIFTFGIYSPQTYLIEGKTD